jgi:hypothetical protein
LPNAVAIESVKKLSAQKLLCFGAKNYDTIGPAQFYQHFWCQSRVVLTQIIFDGVNGDSIWQKCARK